MKRFWEENKKAVLFLLLLIAVFPAVVLWPSPIGCIPRELGIALVGYGGAVLGGFLTLYGVWWTLEDNNRNRRRELELQYAPILRVDIVEKDFPVYQLCSEIVVQYGHPWFEDTRLREAGQLLKFSNVGRGEIKRVRLVLEGCRLVGGSQGEAEADLKESYILCDGVFDFIPVGGTFYLYVNLPSLKEEYRREQEETLYMRLEVTVGIFVEGVFSSGPQSYRLHFFVDSREDRCVGYAGLNTLSFALRQETKHTKGAKG